MTDRPYRIFISSPSDVRPERAIAERIVAKLAAEFRHHCSITAVLWEHEPLLASQHFQDMENIPPPSETDICVVILWSQLGFPLPAEKFRGAISGREVTGTEWEFEDALKSLRARGCPDLLFYQKNADIVASLADEAVLDEMCRQKRAVTGFINRWFKSDNGASFTAAHHVFATTSAFEARLEEHVRKLLLRRLERDLGLQGEAQAITWSGPPWPALAAFDMAQAAIFFGRTKARNELRDRLAAQVKAGTGFVLLIGASGSGKSSLIRAGLLPDLMLPGMVGAVGLVRYGIMRPSDRPSDSGADPFRALAAAILSPTALPELGSLEYQAETLADQLRTAPAQAVFAVRQGLAAAAAGKLTSRGEARLVLVVDQLEEIFAIEAHRADFVATLSALARSGLVWVIAAMRVDFFGQLAGLPALASLAEGASCLLLPPDLGELADIVTSPARAAGVRFALDGATGTRLDQLIVSEAARDPGALPLLSFVLDALWRAPRSGAELSFEAYARLGGLEGAIAQHAETLVADLPQAAQAALPALLLALVAVREGEMLVTARACLMSDLARTEAARLATGRLIEGRLLIADAAPAGATVRLAHESLLRAWPRLAALIEESREAIAAISRLRADLAEWQRAGEPDDLLLPGGTRLSAARTLRRQDLGEALARFIALSEAAASAARQRNRRLVTGAFAALATLAVVAGLGAWYGMSGRFAAEASRNASQRQFEIAETRRAQLLALALGQQPDPTVTEAVSLGAASTAPALRDRLLMAANAKAQRMVIAGHGNQAVSAVFSPDGKRILTASFDKTARVWSAETGALLMTFAGHAAEVQTAAYSPDGTRIVTASADKTVRVWDAATGRQVLCLKGHTAAVNAALFSRDGRLIASGGEDDTVKLWDAASGAPLRTLSGHSGAVSTVDFSPDGQDVLSASLDNTARIWNVATGAVERVLSGHKSVVYAAAYSPDGRDIVTSSLDKTARIWDAASGAVETTLVGHTGGVGFAAFSPDGTRVATASIDKTMRLWDVRTGTQLAAFRGHDNTLVGVAFSPDGRHIATAALDMTARIWDIAQSVPALTLAGHTDVPMSAAFSPDGRRIVTASMDKTVRLWNAGTGAAVGSQGQDHPVLDAAFSPDGTRIATSALDDIVHIWNAADLTAQKTLPGGGVNLRGAAFSPDGVAVATAGFDGLAHIVNLATGATIATLAGHKGWVLRVRYSTDGRRILTASADGTARIWDAATFGLLHVLSGHESALADARFSQDGSRIVTAAADHTARIWDAGSGKLLRILSGHQATVRSAAFSPDGRRVVTASADGTAMIWNAATGATLALLPLTGATVRDAAFSPDGKRIVTASDDKVVRVWDVSDILDESDTAFIRATASRALDSALRSQYALGAPLPPVRPVTDPACAETAPRNLDAWRRGAAAGAGACHQRLAAYFEAGGTPDLAQAFLHHAAAARLLQAQGFAADAQTERYRREALAWKLPRQQVAALMQIADPP
jgi:WD40 repeat protein